MNIIKQFSKKLTAIEYPKGKTSWDIGGIIKGQNAFYKFDVKNMIKLDDGTPAQKGRTNNDADKIVFDFKNKYIIIDVKELHQYLRRNKTKIVHLSDLLSKLEWNIILPK
jgi:hypothetical protein|tara:strand:+ start:2180 stop:2509 length:330 start_codon:yes stop_codon:yes gene_type:complete